jgi:putative ATP-dependent endonuclease of the OLD family
MKDNKGSPLFQLLDFIVMRRFRARADVRALQEEFSSKLKDLYAPSKLSELGELATDISRTLHLYVPNAQFDLRVSEPLLPEIPGPATIAALTEDDYSGAIDKKGHGLQRALIFSLLQHLAVAQPVEAVEQTQGDGEARPEPGPEDPSGRSDTTQSALARPTGPDLIIAIEEPELYQHPLRARHLARILL